MNHFYSTTFGKIKNIFIVITVIVVFLTLFAAPSRIIKQIINHHSESLFGIKMECGYVNISFISGKGIIRNISIFNPGNEDYHYQNAITIDKVTFSFSRALLRKNHVEIKNMEINGANINCEQYRGHSNIIKIIKTLPTKHTKPKKRKDLNTVSKIESYNFSIEKLNVKNTEATIYYPVLGEAGEESTISLNDISMRHIGGEYGTSIQFALRDIINTIFDFLLKDNINKIEKGKSGKLNKIIPKILYEQQ